MGALFCLDRAQGEAIGSCPLPKLLECAATGIIRRDETGKTDEIDRR